MQVCLRVPVAIVQNDDIGGRQVDTETTCTSRQEEDELLAARLVVLVDGDDTIFVCSATIDTTVLYKLVSRRACALRQKLTVLSKQAVIFENVKNAAHLTENEDSGALGFHVLEKLV